MSTFGLPRPSGNSQFFPPSRPIVKWQRPPPVDAPKQYRAVEVGTRHPICREVCEKHGLTEQEMRSNRKTKPLVSARWEAMYRLRHETTLSLTRIAWAVGLRDHSSVVHGLRRYREKINPYSAALADRVGKLFFGYRKDTCDIAQVLGISEAEVVRALDAARELRRDGAE